MPTMPSDRVQALFWDSTGTPSFDRRCERVLGLGGVDDVRDLLRDFGEPAVADWVAARGDVLDRKSRSLWRAFFGLPAIPARPKRFPFGIRHALGNIG